MGKNTPDIRSVLLCEAMVAIVLEGDESEYTLQRSVTEFGREDTE